jgi:membrane-bound ClpP family serine protease
MGKQQIAGYIMAGVGFVMILISISSYLLNYDLKVPSFGIIGLILAVIGTWTAWKSS